MKFYSEKLDKLFNSEQELLEAEKVLEAEQAKKQKAAEEKKADAKVVEDAFKARNAARREYNTKLAEARKEHLEALTAAREKLNKAVKDATVVKDNAEQTYDKVLADFIAKHPEGFHMTLRDGDNVMTISNANDKEKFAERVTKEYNDLFNLFTSFWNF